MSDQHQPWPKFDPMEWEFHVAAFAGAKNDPDMMAIAGVLASMADEQGLVIADPRRYEPGSEQESVAVRLLDFAIMEGDIEPGQIMAFRLGIDS